MVATQADPKSVHTATNGVAIHCRGVTKSYGKGDTRVVALRGIDLDIKRGELMMLVGPSGCGKTTLISVIAGILDRDEGRLSRHEPKFEQGRCQTHFLLFTFHFSLFTGRLMVNSAPPAG